MKKLILALEQINFGDNGMFLYSFGKLLDAVIQFKM